MAICPLPLVNGRGTLLAPISYIWNFMGPTNCACNVIVVCGADTDVISSLTAPMKLLFKLLQIRKHELLETEGT